MAPPNSFDDFAMEIKDDGSDVIIRQTLNPAAPSYFPKNHFLPHCYFSPPPFYLIPGTNRPPPSSIFVYYPLWFPNPNPHYQFESSQELPPLHSQNPSQELSLPRTSRKTVLRWRRASGNRKKMVRTRRIQYQAESNGNHITTVMVRNIPNKFTRGMMIDFLDDYCEAENHKKEDETIPISAYDFLYLPIDFESKWNKGYAFVNFTKAEAASNFKAACCNKQPWCHFYSRKVLEIANARIQGKDELVKHFERMTYPVEAYSPICFTPARSGPKSTVQTDIVGKCSEPVIST